MGIPNSSVDGLKIGSTLNEMYEKLGTPWNKDGNYIGYLYKYNDKDIIINFASFNELYDVRFKEERVVNNNIITDILIIVMGGKDGK